MEDEPHIFYFPLEKIKVEDNKEDLINQAIISQLMIPPHLWEKDPEPPSLRLFKSYWKN